jgi:fimbrial isopeptide formation D2 family protein/uncharacterized repeat protein (TIGR01451 family)
MSQSLQRFATKRPLVCALILTLCAATLLLDQGGRFNAVSASKAALLVPVPTLDLNVLGKEFPSMGLIGEKFCYTARIENTGTDPLTDVGYNPYIQLILPPDITIDNPATDVSLPGVCTGPSCDESSSYPIPLPAPVPNPGPNPLPTADKFGVPVVIPAGYTLWLIQPPIGSLFPGEPGIDVKICLKMSDTAQVNPATLLTVLHKPVFQYGPNFGPAVPGVQLFNDVMPVVVKLAKNALNYTSNKKAPAPTVEIPTGSCHPITFELVANIADSKSLTGIQIQDALPPKMTLLSGTVTVTGVSSFNNCSSTNIVCVNNMSDQGAPGTPPEEFEKRDIVVQFQAYANNDLLNSATCGSATRLNTATVDAFYLGDALPQQSAELLIEVEHVTLQKTANGLPFDPADPLHVIPGQTVEYNLNFQVSSGINLDANTAITDRLPNGIAFQSATLSCGGVPVPISPTSSAPASDGSVLLTFNPGGISDCRKCTIRYLGTVLQTYPNAPLAGQPVLASDPLLLKCGTSELNCTQINYNILGGAQNCSDDTAGGVFIKPVKIKKSIDMPVPPDGFLPGDEVQFRLTLEIPSGDTKSIGFTDFLPAPVFNVGTSAPYAFALGPNHNVGGTFNPPIISSGDNSITMSFNPSDVTTGYSPSSPPPVPTVEIIFKIKITTIPFPDDLNLTNLFWSSTRNTQNTLERHLTGVVLRVRAPKLKLTKGVFGSDNTNAVVSPTPSPDQPNPPVNGNLISGADANDTITYYLTVKNEGGAPAYAVKITDLLPTGMMLKTPLVMAVGSTPTPTASCSPPTCPSPSTPIPAGTSLILEFGTNVLPPNQSWVVKIQLMVPPMGLPCQTLNNSASVSWSSECSLEQIGQCIPSPAFAPVFDPDGGATITPDKPKLEKCILDAGGNCLPAALAPKLSIGGKVRYRVTVTVPEGVANNVTLTDTLDSGLAIVEPNPFTTGFIQAVLASTDLSISGLGASLNGTVTNNGGTLSFNFGKVTNSNSVNTVAEKITLEYTAVVLNTLGNVRGVKLNNSVQWAAESCVTPPVSAPEVTIIEPKLKVTKTYTPALADPGDEVMFTITVMHDPLSDADAFDVVLTDGFSTGVTISNWNCAPATTPCTPGGTGWSNIPLGETRTITFKGTLSDTLKACSFPINSIFMTWTSLPGTPGQLSPHNALAFERTGNSLSDPGLAANTYKASQSVTVFGPLPVIHKTLKSTSAPHTADPNVAIGEEVIYELQVCLPQGTMPPQTVKITDQLPAGMEAISALVTSTGGITGLPASFPVTSGLGALQTFTLSTATVPVTTTTGLSCFTIDLKVRLCDAPGISGLPPNQTSLPNNAKLEILNSNFPICSSTSETPTLSVVEPRLEVKKEFIPAFAKPGDVVQLKLTVTNTGTADVFGVLIQDTLSACLTYQGVAPPVPINYLVAATGNVVTITGNPTLTSISPGAANALTLTLLVRVGECCAINNTATVQGTTMPGTVQCERTVTGSGSGDLIVAGKNCPCYQVPASFNMVSWWPFDETAGTVANDVRATVNNAGAYASGSGKPTPLVPGVVKNALCFDGGDWLESGPVNDSEINFLGSCAAQPSDGEPFTIDVWVRSMVSTGVSTILDKRAPGLTGYSLFLNNGRVGFQLNGNNFSNAVSPNVADGQWHFIAVSVTRCGASPQGRIYVDGTFVHTFSLTGTSLNSLANSAKLWIGRRDPVFGANFFTGCLDELEYFKKDLSEAELDAIYQAGAGGKCKAMPCDPPSFSQPVTYPTNKRPYAIAPGDFNNDGNTDLAVVNTVPGNLAVFEGKFGGVLKTPATYNLNTGPLPRDVIAGHFNSDSLLDLAVAGAGLNKVVSFKNIGGFNFAAMFNYTTGTQPWHLATGLFNNDLLPDLGVVNFGSGDARILQGAGGNAFTLKPATLTDFTNTGNPTWVEAGDFDSDLNADLLVANSATNHVSTLTGNGAGLLTNIGSMNSATKPVAHTVGDFNGDGKLDMAVANNTSNEVRVFTGVGNGFQVNLPIYTVGNQPTSIVTGDLNCDGFLDLVVGTFANNSTQNNVAVLLGNGDATFDPPVFFKAGLGVQDVALADFNNDGRLDIATANNESSSIAILLNLCQCTCNPPAILVQPVSQKVCANATATFTATATGNPPLTMQWEVSTDGGATWTPISGATHNTYTTGETGKLFRAVFTSSCGTAVTNAVSVSLDLTCIKFCPSCDSGTNNLRVGWQPGGTATLSIEAPADVEWDIQSDRNWIIPGDNTAGTGATSQALPSRPNSTLGGIGSGTVNFTFAANPLGVARTGTVLFAGTQYNVTQDAATTIRQVSIGASSGSTSPGSTFNVPLNITAQGDENALFFSLSFDPVVLGNPQVALGSDVAGALLDADDSSVPGKLGLTLLLPAGQTLAAGPRQLAVVSFMVAANTNANSTQVNFDDQPVNRLIQDGNAAVLPANFSGSLLPLGCPTITINPVNSTLPPGAVGAAYNQVFTPSGGNGTFTWTVSAGSLPSGLTLSPATGLLSGTPTVAGQFNFTVRATDAGNCFGERPYTLVINCQTITVNPVTMPNGFVGTAYSQTFMQSGGSGTLTWSINAGTVPAGLLLNAATGVLSGTPTASGSFSFTLRVTGADSCFGERQYTVSVSGNGLQFYPLPAPVRLLDTRAGEIACTQPSAPIAGQTSLTQMGRGLCNIPANAVALTGNITTVQSGGGYLTLYPSNAPQPTVASTNYNANEIINNVFTVGLGPDGAFKIFAFFTTEVVVDVTGYYAPPAANGLYFHPLPKPIRLLETRAGEVGCNTPGAPIQGGAGGTRTQQARLTCDGVTIPNGALAIVGNATTVGPQAGGYLTLFPANAAQPLVASSNYNAGQVVNGPFSVGLAPNGEFSIFSFATTDLVVDVLGYYSTEANDVNGVGLLFNPLPKPVRLLETRANQAVGCYLPGLPLISGVENTQPARGACDGVTIPANALGVVGNATVVTPNAAGFLTLWPSTALRPLVATANYNAGDIGNRHFIVGLGAGDGAFKLFSSATTHLVLDLSGYFAP